jgi:ABC-2 type transport system ATP-binding protein
VNATGTTMFLTTHYMEEADRLCGRLAIIDQGRIVASGSPAELKRSISTERVVVRLGSDGADGLAGAQAAAERSVNGMPAVTSIDRTTDGVVLSVGDAEAVIADVLRCLDGGHVRVIGLSTEKPSLDDVFLQRDGRGSGPRRPTSRSTWAGCEGRR